MLTEFRAIIQDVKILRRKNHIDNPEKVDTLVIGTTGHKTLFNDLRNERSVIISDVGHKPIKSRLVRFLYKAHSCRFSNRLCNLPGKYMWRNYSDLLREELSFKYILVLSYCVLDDETLLKTLRKRYPSSYICVFVLDTLVEGNYWWKKRHLLQSKEVNKVLTFDKTDADRHAWIYTGQCYYSKQEIPLQDITIDLYYVGGIYANRLELINGCYSRILGKLSCVFKLYGENQPIAQGLTLINKRIPYEQILFDVQSCNCILEIVQKGQTGPTLRYFEAVCYNKKLLTNNPAVVELPFYDERYIHVFNSPSEINVDWVARRELVDYHYDGCFSPVHLMELVRKLSDSMSKKISD
jgi:hypothetical protein